MPLNRRRPPPPPTVAEVAQTARPTTTLVGAAAQVKVDRGNLDRLRITDEEWQKEAWRHYDICGELRFASNRHGNALSRCRLYVAELDDLGRPGKECDDPEIQALAETIFGSPAGKAEGLRITGIQMYVAGECYAVAEGASNPESDVWYVVSNASVKRTADGVMVDRPQHVGGGKLQVNPSKDLLIRIWTPHPRIFNVADSPTRAVLPVLREIERLSMLTFSQIDSRLISAGLLLLRQGIDFPRKDEQPGGIEGLMEMILEAARAQLQGAGTAAGLVPIIAEIPADANGSVANSYAHVKFDTPLTGELKDKLDHAIRRLALGLDMDPAEMLGQGDMNHWSGWQIEESTIKIFIDPALTRLCGAFTEAYLRPAIKVLGKDPEKYTLWHDTSPLTVRPNRYEDATTAWDRGMINDEAFREAGSFNDSDKFKDEDLLKWRIWQLVKADPQLLSDPTIAEIIGLPAPVQAGPPPAAPPPQLGPGAEPPPEQPPPAEQPRALPQQPNSTQSPAQSGQDGYALLLPAAEQVVLRALELAGARQLTRHDRGRYADVARFELHTRMPARDHEHSRTLLSGAFTHIPTLAGHFGLDPDALRYLLEGYCIELLVRGFPHSQELLAEVLERGRSAR